MSARKDRERSASPARSPPQTKPMFRFDRSGPATELSLQSWRKQTSDMLMQVAIETPTGYDIICDYVPSKPLLATAPSLNAYRLTPTKIVLPSYCVDEGALYNTITAIVTCAEKFKEFNISIEENPVAYINSHIVFLLLGMKKQAVILIQRMWLLFDRFMLTDEHVSWIWESFGGIDPGNAPSYLSSAPTYIQMMAWQVINAKDKGILDDRIRDYVTAVRICDRPQLRTVIEERWLRYKLKQGYDDDGIKTLDEANTTQKIKKKGEGSEDKLPECSAKTEIPHKVEGLVVEDILRDAEARRQQELSREGRSKVSEPPVTPEKKSLTPIPSLGSTFGGEEDPSTPVSDAAQPSIHVDAVKSSDLPEENFQVTNPLTPNPDTGSKPFSSLCGPQEVHEAVPQAVSYGPHPGTEDAQSASRGGFNGFDMSGTQPNANNNASIFGGNSNIPSSYTGMTETNLVGFGISAPTFSQQIISNTPLFTPPTENSIFNQLGSASQHTPTPSIADGFNFNNQVFCPPTNSAAPNSGFGAAHQQAAPSTFTFGQGSGGVGSNMFASQGTNQSDNGVFSFNAGGASNIDFSFQSFGPTTRRIATPKRRIGRR